MLWEPLLYEGCRGKLWLLNYLPERMLTFIKVAVMHLYFKYTNPLLIQSIIPLKGAFEGNEIKIHLFGTPANGDLKRPFKAPAGLMSSLQGGAAPVQDKKTIAAAEKSGRGGVKDE